VNLRPNGSSINEFYSTAHSHFQQEVQRESTICKPNVSIGLQCGAAVKPLLAGIAVAQPLLTSGNAATNRERLLNDAGEDSIDHITQLTYKGASSISDLIDRILRFL
jgi:hypothetical protein